MLKKLFPNSFGRYSSLPLLGSIAEGFAAWLLRLGYQESTIVRRLRALARVDADLRQRGLGRLDQLTREQLHGCLPANARNQNVLAGTVRALQRFLDEGRLLPPAKPTPPTGSRALAVAYGEHLKRVRGSATSTIRNHTRTAFQFLEHLGAKAAPDRLSTLSPNDVESFVQSAQAGNRRTSLQQVVAHLRGLLRFLAVEGLAPLGLDAQIDTPRLYRFEQLPRALPRDSIRAFLHSIDRKTPKGLRDHAIFFLMATYGLRPCEIVGLTLDDIHWRSGRLRVAARKTQSTLWLPLTEAAGTVLLEYLRRGRPACPLRCLFLRSRAPLAALTPNAVSEAFKARLRRSGLDIAPQGAYCLRHSHAVHLLRRGVALKTIGDLLGHRSAESTCGYLRLAVEDLREVALPLPPQSRDTESRELS